MSDVLLDSNVLLRLLAATDPKHTVAADAVANAIAAGHRVLIAPQVVMEAWVVLTRPPEVNGYGWAPETAKDALDGAMQRFSLARETADVFVEWWRIVADGVCGKRAHARLAALMRVHGIRYVLTFNLDDFKNLPGVIAIEPLARIPE